MQFVIVVLFSREKNEVHAEFKSLFNDHHDLLRQIDSTTHQVHLSCCSFTDIER